jgi:hypothetical protein
VVVFRDRFSFQEVPMYPRNIRVEDPQEALIAEQALAMYRELRSAAANAPDGQVISVAESLAIARGRELTRKSLETVLQGEIEASEKKGLPAEPATAAAAARIAAPKRADCSRPRAL